MRLLPLLALLGAFPPLATDMYLPAIPMLQSRWGVSLSTVNLSLSLFFISFSIGLLICGPLSDRFGRKPVLIRGIGVYVAGSLMCALSQNIYSLIGFRILQGLGAASASALCMAICKDRFEGQEREQILAYIVVIVALAPMLAPILGARILIYADWPWIFVMQAVLGAISLICVCFMRETLETPVKSGLFQMIGRYGRLFRNGRFMGYNLMMAIGVGPMFGFIAGSGDIYIRRFGLTEQAFSYFFAFNAVAMMAGAFACSRLVRRLPTRGLITTGFLGILGGSIWLLITGTQGPWSLALPMFAITFCLGLSRPLCNSQALEQVSTDAGSASALLVFTQFIVAAQSMWIISLNWADKVHTLALMATGAATVALIFWSLLGGMPWPYGRVGVKN